MILIYAALLALFLSLSWGFYLKKIDLFEQEKKWHVIFTFLLGAFLPFLIWPLHTYVYAPLHIQETGGFFSDFFFDTLAVGLVEECIKCLPMLFMLYFVKGAINEPLDYIKYCVISALGFACHENVLYAAQYGIHVLADRAVLAVPAHMMFSAIFCYGLVLYRYRPMQPTWLVIPFFAILAVVSHGFYDFWIGYDSYGLGYLLTLSYFFVMISLFITILNNCINNSPFFSFKTVIDSSVISRDLIVFYLVFMVFVTIMSYIYDGETAAGALVVRFFVFRLFILLIIILRLSRFKIIPGRWNKLKPQLPFRYVRDPEEGTYAFFGLQIRGEGFNEVHINALFGDSIYILPGNAKKSVIGHKRVGIIENKLFLKNDETFYLLRLFQDPGDHEGSYFLLRAKRSGVTENRHNHPIAALLKIRQVEDLVNPQASLRSFTFMEWVVLKPIDDK